MPNATKGIRNSEESNIVKMQAKRRTQDNKFARSVDKTKDFDGQYLAHSSAVLASFYMYFGLQI